MSKKKKKKPQTPQGPIKRWWKSPGVRKFRRRFSDLQRLLYPFAALFVRFWLWTLKTGIKYDRRGPIYDYIKSGKPCVIPLWHQDAFTLMADLIHRMPNYPTLAMASPGRVGQLCGYLMGMWNLKPIYGSSGHGGWEAVETLSKAINENERALLIMADGSRGPARVARWGAIHIARNTGLPIVPCHGWVSHKFIINNWIKLAVPMSWGRGLVLSGEPIIIPKDTPDEELEPYRLLLEQRMNAMVEASGEYFAKGPEVADAWGEPQAVSAK